MTIRSFQWSPWLLCLLLGSVSVAQALPRTVVVDQSQLNTLSAVALSANFVDRVIHDLPVERHLERFASLEAETLEKALDTRQKQLTFWINIYNGYTQHFLKTDPSLYQKDRSTPAPPVP